MKTLAQENGRYTINFVKLAANAQIPAQAREGDAGFDLCAVEHVKIGPFQRRLIKTGLACEIPKGHYGRIAPRSGLALKSGIDVLGGVIDCGYRGEIGIILVNFNVEDFLNNLLVPSDISRITGIVPGMFEVTPGLKIAQLIIEPCVSVNWVEQRALSDSERKEGGFGSSDKKI